MPSNSSQMVTCRIEFLTGALEGLVITTEVARSLAVVGKTVTQVLTRSKYLVVEVIG